MLESIVHYINKNYGSKRGLLNHVSFLLRYRCGRYRDLETVEWERVERLIFVCAGNICRSPLAWICATKLGIESESFGLTGGDGFSADPRAIQFANEHGLDLTAHVTRNIQNYEPRSGDFIIGMEPAHAESLKKYCTNKGVQLTLAGFWLDHPKPYIHDPYSANIIFFNKCERQIIRSVHGMARRLRGEHG